MVTGYKGNKPYYEFPEEAIANGFSNRAFSIPYVILNEKGGMRVKAVMVYTVGRQPYWGYVNSPSLKIRDALTSEVDKCNRWQNAQVA